MIADEELDELDAKAREAISIRDAAPAGPWCRGDAFRHGDAHWIAVNSKGKIMVTSSSGDEDRHVIDFVVAARADRSAEAVIALAAEVRRLKALVGESERR